MATLEILSPDNKDIEKNLELIGKKIKKHIALNYEPKMDEINQVYNIIFEFVKKKKLKIYGGFALNLLLMMKNKSLTLYDTYDIFDIDVYSPNPVDDITELCDILHEKGLTRIQAKPAQHDDTFVLFVNFQEYVNVTYTPVNIYSKMRYIDVTNINEQYNGLKVIHPYIMTIDIFRIFTDSADSFRRTEKMLKRYKQLQKYYSIPKINKNLELNKNKELMKTLETTKSSNIIETLFDYLSQKETILFTGLYIYNYYLYISKYMAKDKTCKYINIPFIEIYSTNYKNDGIELLKFIDNLPEDIKKNIKCEEKYPMFQFNGYSVIMYYDNNPILYMYDNYNRCMPFKKVDMIKFNNNKEEILTNKINIGSFDQNILYLLIQLVRVRMDDNQDMNDIIYTCINGYVKFRNYYLIANKMTIFSESIFESFVIPCMGTQILTARKTRLKYEEKSKIKKNFVWTYNPEKKPTTPNVHQHNFPNTSGNTITNVKKLQLVENNEINENDENDENNLNSDNSNSDDSNSDNKNLNNLNSENSKNSENSESSESYNFNSDNFNSENLN